MQIAIGIYIALPLPLPLTNENQHNHHHHHHQLFHQALQFSFFVIPALPPIIATATIPFSPLCVVTVLFHFSSSRCSFSIQDLLRPRQFIEYRNDNAFITHPERVSEREKIVVLIRRTEKRNWRW